ncbi:DUF3298 and DUF4163 domain-containing protein [Patescibacteria group bacterium]|nr:DUF3298 and DUF4163 domain-containing protein [Patescibacteria group bacterium]
MSLRPSRTLSALLLGAALLGGGCTKSIALPMAPPDESRPASSTVISVNSGDSAAMTTSSRLFFLEGTLPTLGATNLSFIVRPERIQGTYVADKERGMLYGSVTTTNNVWELSLDSNLVGLQILSGQYDEDRGVFTGSIKAPTATTSTAVRLQRSIKPGQVQITLAQLERSWTLQDKASCHTRLEYPIILPTVPSSTAVADEINLQIRRGLGETATTTLEQLLDKNQAECITLQQEEPLMSSEGQDEEFSAARDYEYDTSVLVARNERGLLSLVFFTYFYTGGAHPNSFSRSQTFDLTTGKELRLQDLVRPDRLETWIQREEQALLKTEYGEGLFEKEQAEQIAAGTLKGSAASSTAAYQTLDQWYLSGNELVRFYQPYEIAPYAAGPPAVELPFALWRDLAQPDVQRWF